MSNEFVTPGTSRINLSEGRWVDLKNELTYAERETVTGTMVTGSKATSANEIALGNVWKHYAVERIFVWLVGWSFTDGQDKAVPITRDAIAALRLPIADEITAAIDVHKEALEAEKKVTSGATPAEAKL